MSNVSLLNKPKHLSIWVSNNGKILCSTTHPTFTWRRFLDYERKLFKERIGHPLVTKEELKSVSTEEICTKLTLLAEHRATVSTRHLLTQPHPYTILLIAFFRQPHHLAKRPRITLCEQSYCNKLALIDSRVKALEERIKYRYAFEIQKSQKSQKPTLVDSKHERLST